jgi:hypothetical protein
MRIFVKRLIIVLISLFIIILLLVLNSGKKPDKFEYGVTFSAMQAQNLGLDWKQAYNATLDDLQVKLVRIPVYWNQVEPKEGEYHFQDLDYQLQLAQQHNAKVVLTVGQRVPRWPECFLPDWVKNLSSQELKNNALLSFIEAAVTRYYNSPAVATWQVENEPFLSTFGECPKLDVGVLDREIALVKKLDPSRPVLVSDSGELSSWLQSSKRGDLFGTTLYRFVFSDVFKRYWVNYIPFWFYRLKGGYVRLFHPGKQIAIIELQAEPWTTKGILNTPIDEQFKTMSMQKFDTILGVARATGYSPQYLWGVEWWYWMKQNNHPEFWDKAKLLYNQ